MTQIGMICVRLRVTDAWYLSTPQDRNLSGHGRLSFPFFLDPGFTAEVPPLPDRIAADQDGRRRWDGQDLRASTGTYGGDPARNGAEGVPAAPARRPGIGASQVRLTRSGHLDLASEHP